MNNGRPVVNGIKVELPDLVTDTLIVDEGILVAVNDKGVGKDRNVYLISPDGRVLWQIEDPYPHLKDHYRGYTSLFFSVDGRILAGCWVGVDFEVDVKTGKIKPWVDPKVPNKRPW